MFAADDGGPALCAGSVCCHRGFQSGAGPKRRLRAPSGLPQPAQLEHLPAGLPEAAVLHCKAVLGEPLGSGVRKSTI